MRQFFYPMLFQFALCYPAFTESVSVLTLEALRAKAEQGDAAAQLKLGLLYQNGTGIVIDYAEAVKWFRKSAEEGDPRAQFNLGSLYYRGLGVPRDDAEAVK